ncbi:TPA: hypothetical protein JBB06_04630 [Legionella pneumophila subsp. pneumophila]|uniref:U-box domain-containing protein n=1 Tax=Legionella pneumophila (strain Lens) TaxID=297245 RepID=Q5WTZ9_LEGPL|nr:hypothetical protein [Legionella pneumophila]AOW51068.1 hypothetical protein BE841_00645 [Legionella pneumophila subsp. pneumophila]AOW55331.1 hypothetical protein BE842_08110 [Legionella pneumophila subsp. pneumophila]AOW64575.1 hypothetical protein BE845_11105 [Legionella pneumophila subsp. pneumophila]RYW82838.1 hypothetical protein D7216_10905 [Legionella pneumophila]RYW91508.1 hypothetical protein D7221_02215 [Legionella pneumophila]
MTKIVYLQNDPDKMLYYKDSVPKDLKVVEPDAKMMLEILEQKLKLLEVLDLDWFYCAICMELPKEPVFYPTTEGISNLYEKSELVKWFSRDPRNKSDPVGLGLNVSISQYKTPTPKELLDFVIKSTGFAEEVFIEHYKKPQVNKAPPEEELLLEKPDYTRRNEIDSPSHSQQRSCLSLFLYSIFGCKGKRYGTQEKPESLTSNYLPSNH